jgi:hypothetical protein
MPEQTRIASQNAKGNESCPLLQLPWHILEIILLAASRFSEADEHASRKQWRPSLRKQFETAFENRLRLTRVCPAFHAILGPYLFSTLHVLWAAPGAKSAMSLYGAYRDEGDALRWDDDARCRRVRFLSSEVFGAALADDPRLGRYCRCLEVALVPEDRDTAGEASRGDWGPAAVLAVHCFHDFFRWLGECMDGPMPRLRRLSVEAPLRDVAGDVPLAVVSGILRRQTGLEELRLRSTWLEGSVLEVLPLVRDESRDPTLAFGSGGHDRFLGTLARLSPVMGNLRAIHLQLSLLGSAAWLPLVSFMSPLRDTSHDQPPSHSYVLRTWHRQTFRSELR